MTVLVSMIVDAQRMAIEGVSFNLLFRLFRSGLTGTFMVLLATAYLIRVGALEKAEGFRERAFPMLVFLLSIVGLGILLTRPGAPNFYLAGGGLVLGSLGLCISIWAVWHLRGSFSIMAEARRTVVSGPYQYVRHPLYLGEILTLLGGCLLVGTGIALLFWALICAAQLTRARIEEKKLCGALSDYATYRKETPFIIPNFPVRSR